MRVLVACEESQEVCKAFRALGHEAYSCDIEPCSGMHPEWHIQGDALKLINGNKSFVCQNGDKHCIDGTWDMIIAHPPCTYLTTCCNRAYSLKCNSVESVLERYKKRDEAVRFFVKFSEANCPRIAIENPQGYMNTHFRKPDCIVHPYFFAESENDVTNYQMKKTCFWLYNLPPLKRKTYLPKPKPKYICQGEKSKGKAIGWCEGMSGTSGGRKGRAKARSKTFPGIARAMSIQWGGDIRNLHSSDS